MLSLNDDAAWEVLRHAYGPATDIPPLLLQLAVFPPYTDYESEPYFSLWSALCHQGDVYTASYAAVPHIVEMLEANPPRAHWSALLLVVSIEIARVNGRGPLLSGELKEAYDAALARLPGVVAELTVQSWDEVYTRVGAAALALGKSHPALAEAILELQPGVVQEFMDWIEER
jgi:hypothetical protein